MNLRDLHIPFAHLPALDLPVASRCPDCPVL